MKGIIKMLSGIFDQSVFMNFYMNTDVNHYILFLFCTLSREGTL